MINNLVGFNKSFGALKQPINDVISNINGDKGKIDPINMELKEITQWVDINKGKEGESPNFVEQTKSKQQVSPTVYAITCAMSEIGKLHAVLLKSPVSASDFKDISNNISDNTVFMKELLNVVIKEVGEVAVNINNAGSLAVDEEFFKSKFANVSTIIKSIDGILKVTDKIGLKQILFARTKLKIGMDLVKFAAQSAIDLDKSIMNVEFSTVPGKPQVDKDGNTTEPKDVNKVVAVMGDVKTIIDTLKFIMSSTLADKNFDKTIAAVYKNLPNFEKVMKDIVSRVNNLSDEMKDKIDYDKFEHLGKPFEVMKTVIDLSNTAFGPKEIAKIYIKTEMMTRTLKSVYAKYDEAFKDFKLNDIKKIQRSSEIFIEKTKIVDSIIKVLNKNTIKSAIDLRITKFAINWKFKLLRKICGYVVDFSNYILEPKEGIKLKKVYGGIDLFNKIIESVSKINFNNIKNIGNGIRELISITIDFIKLKVLTKVFSSKKGTNNIINYVEGLSDLTQKCHELLIKNEVDYVALFNNIKFIDKTIVELIEVAKSYTLLSVLLLLVPNVKGTSDKLYNILESIEIVLLKVADIKSDENLDKLDNISKVLTNSMLSLALFGVVAVLTGPIALLGLLIFEVLLAPIMVITEELSKIDKDIESASRSLLIISASFVLFTISMAIISQIAINENLFLGTVILGMTVAIAVYAMTIINDMEKDIIDGAKALFIISGAFILFVISIALLSTIIIERNLFLGMIALLAITGIAVGAMYFISKFNSDIVKGALSLLIISGSFILFTVSLIMMNNLLDNWEGVLLGIIGLTVIVGVCVALLMVIGNGTVMSNIFMGSLALLLVSASLTLSALSLLAVAKITEEIHWGWLIAGIVSMGVVCTAVAGIGVMMLAGGIILIAAATIGMVMVSGVISIMSMAMKVVNDMQLDPDKIAENIFAINFGVGLFISSLPGIVPLTLAMLKIPQILALSLAIMSVGTAVSMIANLRMATGFDKEGNPTGYRQLKDSDFETAADNTVTIVMTMFSALMMVYRSPGVSAALKGEGLFGASPIGKLIRFTRRLGGAISGVARGVADMASLKVADKWDKSGNPTSYRHLKEGDFTLAQQNIGKIVTALFDSLIPLAQDENIKEALKGRMNKSPFGKVLNIVSKMGGAISDIASGIQDFANMRVANAWDKNGKPTSYLIMSDTVLTQAKDNIVTVVTSMIKSLVPLTQDKDIAEAMVGGGLFGLGEGKLGKIMNVVSSIGSSLTDIASNIVSYATLSFKDVKGTMVTLKATQIDDAEKNIYNIFNAILKGYAAIDKKTIEDANKKIELIKKSDLKSINSSFITPITNLTAENTNLFDKAIDSTDRLVKTVNTVDVSKLKATKELIDSVTKLTNELNENFNKMSDTLGGKLVKAIEELNKVLGGMGDIDVNATVSSNTSTASNLSTTSSNTKSINPEDLSKLNNVLNGIKGILSGIEDEGVKVKGTVKLSESY